MADSDAMETVDKVTESTSEEGTRKRASDNPLGLPLSRVKRIILSDGDVKHISGEAASMIARATELFIESMVQEAYKNTKKEKRKLLAQKDILKCVQTVDQFEFLTAKTTAMSILHCSQPFRLSLPSMIRICTYCLIGPAHALSAARGSLA
ncbi:histone-like transcription factor family (CBF/NF-Y) [Planoprotostelium fungivorum]|uniref:Histone-like transcription factor family (CBF/NF-Y) n=1 Tax=Planoprotostelium fungivorum TaxID=1890364 RepID=A0A2P6NWN4_9EUKA|nr:histone-like transcription factor family (CBF/NF-Y) [Planoprotostelium fungivorum]